jgi:esterase/lipase superfamily enzyme
LGEATLRKLGVVVVTLAALALASCGQAPKSKTAPVPAPTPPVSEQAAPPGSSAPDAADESPSDEAQSPEARSPANEDEQAGPPSAEEKGLGGSSGASAPRYYRRAQEPSAGDRAEPGPMVGSPAPGASAPDAQGASAPDAPGAPPPPAPSAPSAVGTAPPAAQPSVPPKAAATDSAWDVVPVFYGTDRAQTPNEKRVDYGSERGRRLELGRALVTVPKAHKVPSIERPWAIRVPYLNVTLYEEAEDPTRHFTMDEIKALSEQDFLALVHERLAASSRYKDHAFIFVHGYNTTFDYALYRTAQISYDLKFDGAAFAYSWPSGGGLASYTYDRESSGQAEPYLRDFMELVIAKTGAKSVSIIAHSMGNQPTLQVLRDLKNAKPAGVRISQIVLAAPDVDRDNFENIAKEIRGLADGVTLYAAGNDRALIVSRNFYGGIPRAGDVPPTGPLILPGIDTIDVTAAGLDSLALNHSLYAENNKLLADIAALFSTGTRPPKLRTPAFEEVTTDRGTYWRYPVLR